MGYAAICSDVADEAVEAGLERYASREARSERHEAEESELVEE